MGVRENLAALLWIGVLVCVPFSAACQIPPCRSDIQIGEDDTRYYCLPHRIVDDCRADAKRRPLQKCVHDGCIGQAGVRLEKQRQSCITQTKTCLEDNHVTETLIGGITTCLLGLATPAPGATCFLGAGGASAVHDYSVNLCKSRFGDCMDPALDEHRNQIRYCSALPRF